MKKAGWNVLPIALSCALAAVLPPLSVRAAEGAIRQIPASGIAISRFTLSQQQQGYVFMTGMCVAFTNQAPVTATKVQFLYSLIGRNGKVVYSQVQDTKGAFAPGVLISGANENMCSSAYAVSYGGTVATRDGDGSMVVSVSQVHYADGTAWHAGPDVTGAVLEQSTADVHIVKAFSWEPGESTQECVAFTNGGSKTVKHVHFMLSHVADDGSDVVDDPMDDYSVLAPGASQALSCRGWNGSLTPRAGAPPVTADPQILVFDKQARLVAWMQRIDYTDGTSWTAPDPGKDVIAAAAAPDKVDYSHATWWPPALDVMGIGAATPASGITIAKTYAWDPGTPYECVDFTVTGDKQIRHVKFQFSHVTAAGLAGEEEPLDVRGAFDPGKTQERKCRSFQGFVILPAQWSGGATTAQTLTGGDDAPSTVHARVDEVDYADGTAWRAAGTP